MDLTGWLFNPGTLVTTPEYRIISRLTQPNTSPSTAVEELIELTRAAISPTYNRVDRESDHFTRTAVSLLEIAAQTPDNLQASLVDFTCQLQRQVVLDPSTGEQYRHAAYHNVPVWTRMPELGINGYDYRDIDMDNPPQINQRRYENLVAFWAKLIASPEQTVSDPAKDIGPFEYSLWSLWDLRYAFERTTAEKVPGRFNFRVACLWLIYGGERLWSYVNSQRAFSAPGEHNVAAAWDSKLIGRKHWRGYNRDRWGLWVQGLHAAAESLSQEDDESTITLVNRALGAVDRIMDQGWRIREEEKFA